MICSVDNLTPGQPLFVVRNWESGVREVAFVSFDAAGVCIKDHGYHTPALFHIPEWQAHLTKDAANHKWQSLIRSQITSTEIKLVKLKMLLGAKQ